MAQIEILGLYEGTPQIAAAQAGDTYKAPVTLQAATGNEVALELAYTVNKATSGNDTGLLINMTDTASPGTSLPFDIQVGGSSKFNIRSDGKIDVRGQDTWIDYGGATGVLVVGSATADNRGFFGLRTVIGSGGWFAFAPDNTPADQSDYDLALFRDAAGTLAQRNSTNAQTFRLYGTYTDSSNYERVSLITTAGDCTISTEAAGTGTRRNILLDGANRVAKITDVSSGTDTAYETAINAIIDALEAHGLAATA